jgi:hypothetical protein
MTDRKKFEAMLEALINEDHEAAKDIFHNIVVAKSREIYENLLSEEAEEEFEEAFGDDDEESDDDEEADNFGADDEESDDEFGSDDEEGDDEFGADDEESDDDIGGDDEFGGDEFGDEESDSELEDRVLDLEDALDELKSEFEQLLAGEENEPEHKDMFGDDELGGDLGGFDDEEGEEENEFQSMFEYVNKVALPKHGDNGVNNKSIFNKPKYNDMGGVAPKFGKTASGEGTKGGLLNPSTSKMDGGNQNVPGNTKAPKLKPVPKGHGAEKKSSGDNGINKRSLIPGRK